MVSVMFWVVGVGFSIVMVGRRRVLCSMVIMGNLLRAAAARRRAVGLLTGGRGERLGLLVWFFWPRRPKRRPAATAIESSGLFRLNSFFLCQRGLFTLFLRGLRRGLGPRGVQPDGSCLVCLLSRVLRLNFCTFLAALRLLYLTIG